MNTRPAIVSTLRYASCLAALGAVLLAAGCSDGRPAQLRFEPQEKLLDYQHAFTAAFAAPAEGGGYDVVLVSGFAPESQTQGKVVQPAEYRPMRQIMHVQVAWRPQRGSRGDSPAISNATLRYHVFSGETTGPASRASYSGAGFARLEVGDDSTTMDIRDAMLRPVAVVGGARDPLGPSRVTGKVTAQNNAPRVRALLEQLNEVLETASGAASAQ